MSRRASSSRWCSQSVTASSRGRAGRLRPQLQRQAFAQRARAHAGGLQALQPLQRAAQPVVEFVARFRAVQAQHVGQPLGDLFQRVGQVAVAVQRFDQHLAARRGRRRPAACPRSARAGGLAASRRRRGGPAAPCRRRRPRRCRPLRWTAFRGCRRSRRARCRSPSRRARWCRTPRRGSRARPRRRRARRRGSRRRCRRRGRPPGARAAFRRGCGGESSSASRKGFWSSICPTSWCSSSVDSCSRRIDCCSCGVSARCCDRRTCSDGFMARRSGWPSRHARSTCALAEPAGD